MKQRNESYKRGMSNRKTSLCAGEGERKEMESRWISCLLIMFHVVLVIFLPFSHEISFYFLLSPSIWCTESSWVSEKYLNRKVREGKLKNDANFSLWCKNEPNLISQFEYSLSLSLSGRDRIEQTSPGIEFPSSLHRSSVLYGWEREGKVGMEVMKNVQGKSD